MNALLSASVYPYIGIAMVGILEYSYAQSIKAERAAQAALRASLRNQIDFISDGKKIYHWITETLLCIPVVRLVVFAALAFFVGLNSPVQSVQMEESLWKEGKISELIQRLEEDMQSPAGITWTLQTRLKKAPVIPVVLTHISKYCLDLTAMAERGELRPFFGREKEMGLIAEILGCNLKSNPLLVGPPGVGKTAFGDGISQCIVWGAADLHPAFQGKRVYLLRWDRLSIGASSYGEDTVQKRLLSIITEAIQHKQHVLLFLDEIHAFLKPDSEISNTLKPYLADGSIKGIGATTGWDYDRLIEQDPALERRFPKVMVGEPTDEEMRQVLHAVIPVLESHHNVQISDEAVEVCIELCRRYIKSFSFPDKAIEILDRAASRLSAATKPYQDPATIQLSKFIKCLLQMRSQLGNHDEINQKIQEIRGKFTVKLDANLVRSVVSERVSIPLDRLQESEVEVLGSLEQLLSKCVVGQKRPIRLLSQGVRRARVRLGNQNAPAGVFLFLGTTGVGKTATAEALCEILYGSKESMLRLDMSEYTGSHDGSKLIGSPPGYTGHGEGGKLTNWLKQRPASIVLLDEIEKAHPNIHQLFLQVFDAGRITDGRGETVRCLDTMFVMTSNIGARIIQKLDSTSDIDPYESDNKSNAAPINTGLPEGLEEELGRHFKPEFLNRIQEPVVFYPLTKDEIDRIAGMQCQALRSRVLVNPQCPNIDISWDEDVIPFLVKYGYNPLKGAREMHRCISRNMEYPLADRIVLKQVKSGDKVRFKVVASRLQLEVLQAT